MNHRREGPVDLSTWCPGTSEIDWGTKWDKFRNEHSKWYEKLPPEKPVYYLPQVVVDEFVRSRDGDDTHREVVRLINREEEAAERSFLELCLSLSVDVVGFWNDRPIRYPLLASGSERSIPDVVIKQLRLPTEHVDLAQSLVRASASHRLALVGAQVLTPLFQQEVTDLQRQWDFLGRPLLFPFDASSSDQPPRVASTTTTPFSAEVASLIKDIGAWLRRRQLSRLITWDLPEAPGVLEGIPIGLAASICGSDLPSTPLLPPGSTGPGRDPSEATSRLQKVVAQAAGDVGLAAGKGTLARQSGEPPERESAFRFWLVERTVRCRYPELERYKSRLKVALANLLPTGISESRVKQIRKLYLPFVDPTV